MGIKIAYYSVLMVLIAILVGVGVFGYTAYAAIMEFLNAV